MASARAAGVGWSMAAGRNPGGTWSASAGRNHWMDELSGIRPKNPPDLNLI